jgi:hypothetical protein
MQQTSKIKSKSIGGKKSSQRKVGSRKSSELSQMSTEMGGRDRNRESDKRRQDRDRNRESERRSQDRDRSIDRSSMERDRKGGKGKERRVAPMMRSTPGMFDRNIFRDPFFTENWEDLFNIGSSFNDIIHKARDMTKSTMRGADQKNIDTSHPGSYTSKSFYRTYSGGPGQQGKREVVSQETITNVDEQGRKFVERWKTHEHGNEKRTSHQKMIDDKGIKEMRKQLLDTGEEYEHIDYRKLNDKEINNFNSEFERGLRHIRDILPSQQMLGMTGMPRAFRNMLPDTSRMFGGMDRDIFSDHHHDRFGLPMGDMGYDQHGTRSSDITRPQSSQLTDSGRGKATSGQDNRGYGQSSAQGSTLRGR